MLIRLLTLLLSLGVLTASAQIKLTIVAPDTVDPGESFTADVLVNGFTAITSANFEIEWDPDVIEVGSVEIPVDTISGNTPFASSFERGAARFLYLEQTGDVGGNLPDESVLLRLNCEAVGNAGDTSPFEITGQNLATEFIERAMTELMTTVCATSVHLRNTVSTTSLEQHKFKSHWTQDGNLKIKHGLLGYSFSYALYTLAGQELRQGLSDPSSEYTLLSDIPTVQLRSYVLQIRTSEGNFSVLIPALW